MLKPSEYCFNFSSKAFQKFKFPKKVNSCDKNTDILFS